MAHSTRLSMLCLLLVFWTVSLDGIAVVPTVYEDEPWQASTGWKIAREGVFGTDLFDGYFGMDRRYYGHTPLHPLLLAAVFTFAGLGLFQARFETLVAGALILALTFRLGRTLFGDRVALLAAVLLLTLRVTQLSPTQVSGIPFIDISRVSRYDILVPVFGLASLLAYCAARADPRWQWYFLAGVLASLSALAHVYGAFWLPALLILAAWDGAAKRHLGALLAGFALPVAPYALYVLADLRDWQGQTLNLGYAARFRLLDARWYVSNLLYEPGRYAAGLGRPGPQWLARPGLWLTVAALPASGVALGAAARAGDHRARVVIVPLLLFPGLFALLLSSKMPSYVIAFVPLAALAVAWSLCALWRRVSRWPGSRAWRAALALLLVAALFEGVTRLVALDGAARSTVPYAAFIARVRAYVPAGARVLGLHNYWLGFEDHEYRSFVLPLLMSDGSTGPDAPSFDRALDRIHPDAVLVDRHMREYFESDARRGGVNGQLFDRWLARAGVRLAGRVDDPDYGRVDVYVVSYAASR